MDQADAEKINYAQETKEKAPDRLEKYIKQGLEFIKSKDFEAASVHFKNRQIAESLGLFYEDGQSFGLKVSPTEGQIARLADSVARNSWFWSEHPERTIELSDVYPIPPNEAQVEMPEALKHEIALVHAEEWLHALQYLRGHSLTGQKDGESDVALYLKRHEVPITETFLKRYPSRSEIENLS